MSSEYSWIGHFDRYRVIEIHGVVVNKEPLRIGAGKTSVLGSPIDLPILRVRLNDRDVPFIPGSSWKGVFRSYFDTVIRSNGGFTCEPTGKATCMSQPVVCDYCGSEIEEDRLEKIARRLSAAGNYQVLRRLLWENLCLSCKLFGSQSYKSKIVFYDSFPLSEVRIGVRAGIAIDRRTGAAAQRALYQVEYIEPGAEFSFHITMDTIPNYAVGLLVQALKDLKAGLVKIGGFKTRGFGLVDLKDIVVEVKVFHEKGGSIRDNKIVLSPLDSLDKEVEVETASSSGNAYPLVPDPFKGNSAWSLLEKFLSVWIERKDDVIKAHIPRWRKSVQS